ncbi:MAG: M1 family metallopeptidase [Bacteroidales bacterium]
MKHLFLLSGIICLATIQISAQQKSYFQQEVRYDIDVILEPSNASLTGNYQLTYTNHSPDTLKELFLHLYPNAYGHSESMMAQELPISVMGSKEIYFADEEKQGNITDLHFTSARQKITSHYLEPDIIRLQMQKPLAPGDSILLETPFTIKVPAMGYSRMGHDNDNYQITQWFPKPAVYDRQGWHLMPNRTVGEYYGEFGDFKIRLNVPKYHTVGSTGVLIKEEAYKPQQLKSEEKAPSLETIPYKSLYIQAHNVHTFAWCSGKDYRKMSREIEVPGRDKKINAHILYQQSEAENANKWREHWESQFETIQDAINFYSEKVGPYPYPQVTVAQSVGGYGGGMEYPMFTILDQTYGLSQEALIMHEIGHNWFYGVLGFNEREHPWMDEGINSFYEARYMMEKYPDLNLQDYLFDPGIKANLFGTKNGDYVSQSELSYLMLARKKLDKPTNLHSEEYQPFAYFQHTYQKPTVWFYYLFYLTGSEDFDKFMHSFWNEWKFKHPQPEDFYAHLHKHFPDLAPWFVDEVLKDNKRVDYAIKKMHSTKDSVSLKIKNKGEMQAPFILQVQQANKKPQRYLIKGFKDKKTIRISTDTTALFSIDPDQRLPELNRKNNEYEGKSYFPKSDGIKLKWLYHIPDAESHYIFHTPVLGYNVADSWMPGWLFYNDPVFSVPVHYRLAPFFSTSTGEMTGEGRISYTHYSRKPRFQGWQLSVYGKRYNTLYKEDSDPLTYNKLNPEINLYFSSKHKDGRKASHRAGLSYHYLNREADNPGGWIFLLPTVNAPTTFHLWEGWYHFSNRFINRENEVDVNMQYHKGHLKLSSEYKLRLQYDGNNNAFEMRLFAGAFLAQGTDKDLDMRFRLGNWKGRQDYLYDHTMLYRGFNDSEQLWSHQAIIKDGGFNVMTNIGQSWEHMAALNLHADLPFGSVLDLFGVFANLGHFGVPDGLDYDSDIFWESGVTASIYRENFRIYYTAFGSNELMNPAGTESPGRLRFILNFDFFNPFQLTTSIDPTYK